MTDSVKVENEAKFCMVSHNVFDLGLSAGAIALYAALLKFADNDTRAAHPARKTLAEMLGCSVRTVDKHLEELENVGLVRSFPRWRDTEGKVSSSKSAEFNMQTSNGYVVQGYMGASIICTRPRAGSAPGPVQNLRTNYTHSELDPSLTRESAPAKNAKGTRISEDWMPKPETVEKIKASVPGLDIATEHEKFIDYFLSVSGEKGVKKDWDAAWRNWMRRAKQWSADSPSSGGGKSDYFKNMAATKAQQLAVGGQAELEGF